MNKGRLEAFTNAIAAIAATVMVLELKTTLSGDLQGLLAQRHVLLAYLTMIYIVWYNHHNFFQKAERITKHTFFINELWLFFLTPVPFTTGWVGTAPDAAVPELLYPLNLLAWSSAFHLLDRQILQDNAGAVRENSTRALDRVFMYGGTSSAWSLPRCGPGAACTTSASSPPCWWGASSPQRRAEEWTPICKNFPFTSQRRS